MQMLLSPMVGMLADHQSYTQIVWIVAIPPLLSAALLARGIRSSTSEGQV